jgi:hypothetical protein
VAAEMQRGNGVTRNMRDKELRVWRRWLEHARLLIDFEHFIWPKNLSPEGRAKIMGAFAAAVQRRQFSSKMGEMFRANMEYNPTHGVGNHSFHKPAI